MFFLSELCVFWSSVVNKAKYENMDMKSILTYAIKIICPIYMLIVSCALLEASSISNYNEISDQISILHKEVKTLRRDVSKLRHAVKEIHKGAVLIPIVESLAPVAKKIDVAKEVDSGCVDDAEYDIYNAANLDASNPWQTPGCGTE